QTQRVDGLPLGTRGGLIVDHLFPADGYYQVNINGLAGADYVRGMEYAHTLVVLLDGVQVFQGRIGGEEDIKAIDQRRAARGAAITRPLPATPPASPARP